MITNMHTYVRNNDIAAYAGGANYEYPAFWIVIRRPSYYVRADVVPVDTPFVPAIYGYDVKAPLPQNVTIFKPALDENNLDNFLGVHSYGSMLEFAPSETAPVPKNPNKYILNPEGMLNGWGWWDGSLYLMNGTTYTAPNGDYRFLIRASKDPIHLTDPKNYDSWLSPVVRLNL